MTWRYLSGNTASFAVELALIADDTDDWMIDADERASWGALALWVDGVNVCEHTVQGETLRFAHWYLLPIAEWLIENWDPLLHEERLPVASAGATAARGVVRAAVLGELDANSGRGTEVAEALQSWHERHSLRAGAQGGILPEFYIRRYGDNVEFSTGTEQVAGEDWGVAFSQHPQAARLPVSEVATAVGDALESLAAVLLKRDPDSVRYRSLAEQTRTLDDPGREPARFAWLSGAGDRLAEFGQLWQEVQTAIPAELRQELTRFAPPPAVGPRLVATAPPAALLFGSLAPDVSADDVVALYTSLIAGSGEPRITEKLRSIGAELLASWSDVGISPGEQGSIYGEEAWRTLAEHQKAPECDIEKILAELGIAIDEVDLRDRSVRAVSMVGVDGTARIVVNRSFRLGTGQPVKRFTLAHELGHLLLDQDRASRM
ncbi:MAG: hypothetical protein ACRDQ5_24815, partial [Sciscionella sp.]